jgi:lipopolysaccharide biosynthesis protein
MTKKQVILDILNDIKQYWPEVVELITYVSSENIEEEVLDEILLAIGKSIKETNDQVKIEALSESISKIQDIKKQEEEDRKNDLNGIEESLEDTLKEI